MRARETLLPILLLVNLLAGCSPQVTYVSKYGVAFNGERQLKGIPPIPLGWEVQDMGYWFDCINPVPDVTKPHRLMKRVSVGRDGNIASESDTFYSGKKFFNTVEQIWSSQVLCLEFHYSGGGETNRWRIHVSLDDENSLKEVTIEEADQLLASWGLSRNQ